MPVKYDINLLLGPEEEKQKWRQISNVIDHILEGLDGRVDTANRDFLNEVIEKLNDCQWNLLKSRDALVHLAQLCIRPETQARDWVNNHLSFCEQRLLDDTTQHRQAHTMRRI